jgi:putative transferase (TIGR04331 family)
MFWNPEFWELSDAAIPYFEALRQASVLFDDPVTCAAHVNSVWGDVPTWWESEGVQSAVRTFKDQFAYTGQRPLRELKAALTQW